MRLGLIADIHEQVEFLRAALNRFHQEQVDRVVVLGDVFETGERIKETCWLLAEAQAVGVWETMISACATIRQKDSGNRYGVTAGPKALLGCSSDWRPAKNLSTSRTTSANCGGISGSNGLLSKTGNSSSRSSRLLGGTPKSTNSVAAVTMVFHRRSESISGASTS